MVSNAPRVRASDRAPAFAAPPSPWQPLATWSRARPRARFVPVSARVPRAPVSRARVSRRGRRADRGCVPRFARPPAQGAHRGDAPPRQVRPSGRVRAALARHPRPVPGVRRGFPNPSVAADALARVRGDADDVEDATCAALARHRLAEAGYPARATSRASPARRPKPPAPPRARVGGASRGRLRPRARRRARAQPRIRRARRFPVPPPALPARQRRLTRRRARRRRARARGRARVRDDARAALDACRDEHDAVGDAGTSSSASAARLGRRREPLPLAARAAARVRAEAARDAGVRAQTPIFAQRLWQTFSHVEALERARASRRVRLRESRRGSPRVSAIPPRRPRDRRFLRPRTRCC